MLFRSTRSLTFLSMMKSTSPIDGYISILPVEFNGGANRSAGGCLTKLKKPVENRAVLADIEPLEMTRVGMVVNSDRRNTGEEVDVLLRVEAADVVSLGREGAVDFHFPVKRVVDDEIVGHANAVGFHGVALSIVVVTYVRLVEICHAPLSSVGT